MTINHHSIVSASTAPSCGDTSNDADDCTSEHRNAVANNNLQGFCDRCENEGGANPLRNRCSQCQCCSATSPPTSSPTAGPTSPGYYYYVTTYTYSYSYYGYYSYYFILLETDASTETEASTGPACGNTTNDSDDCTSEHGNAVANGNLQGFCDRCQNEGGANPLRNRCSECQCCSATSPPTSSPTAGPTAGPTSPNYYYSTTYTYSYSYYSYYFILLETDAEKEETDASTGPACGDTSNDADDCTSEHGNAVANGNLQGFCDRCENEGGANPLRNRCSQCQCCSATSPPTSSPTAGPTSPNYYYMTTYTYSYSYYGYYSYYFILLETDAEKEESHADAEKEESHAE